MTTTTATKIGKRSAAQFSNADARDCAWAWADALIVASSASRQLGQSRIADRLLDAASATIASVEGPND